MGISSGDYFDSLQPTTPQETCIDCSCQQVPLDDNTCKALHDMNDEKVMGASKILADAELCDYTKIFPKILYSLWCMIKNIIATLCWLLTRMKDLENKVKNLCATVACVVAYLKARSEEEVAKALGNVKFAMTSKGEQDGQAYTVVKTSPDGSFDIQWNMVYSGSQIGTGSVKGKVNHTYSVNTDGSIKASIIGFTLTSMTYNGSGSGLYPNARFVVYDKNGAVLVEKKYNPYNSFSDILNKTVTYNFNYNLAPNGGTSGDVILLKTLDDWEFSDTTSVVGATYTNNNQPVMPFECVASC